MKRFLLLPILVLSSLAMAKTEGAPGPAVLGAAAPPLKLAQWIQGTPVTDFVKGNVYVVEFWATWCGPCKVSIPHLNEMSHKYAGKATFVGVSVWENRSERKVDTEQLPQVASFVKNMGDKMSYNVAADTSTGDMDATWLRPYNQNGIPCAFIIDQQGRVAYVNHPMDPKFEDSLQQVIAGKFDIAKAKAEMDASAAAEAAAEAKMAAISADLKAKAQDLTDLAKGGMTHALEAEFQPLTDKYANMAPKEIGVNATARILSLLMHYNEPVFYTYLKEQANGQYANDGATLNSYAWNILTVKSLKNPDYKLALSLAQKACTASNNDPEIMDTLALAYFKTGDKAKAVATEKEALAKVTDPTMKKDFQDNIDLYSKG